jgi:hypothetical protein
MVRAAPRHPIPLENLVENNSPNLTKPVREVTLETTGGTKVRSDITAKISNEILSAWSAKVHQ